jgi:excisionase family DNA binding protein
MEKELVITSIPVTQLKLLIAETIRLEFVEGFGKLTKTKEDDAFLKIEEVCAILHVSKVTVHKWKSNGLLPFYRLGSKIYFKKSEILAAAAKANNRFTGGKS